MSWHCIAGVIAWILNGTCAALFLLLYLTT